MPLLNICTYLSISSILCLFVLGKDIFLRFYDPDFHIPLSLLLFSFLTLYFDTHCHFLFISSCHSLHFWLIGLQRNSGRIIIAYIYVTRYTSDRLDLGYEETFLFTVRQLCISRASYIDRISIMIQARTYKSQSQVQSETLRKTISASSLFYSRGTNSVIFLSERFHT